MLCFSIVLWLRRLGKSAPKNGRVRRIGCPRCHQNLHHPVARERLGSQNLKKAESLGAFFEVEIRSIFGQLWKTKAAKPSTPNGTHMQPTCMTRKKKLQTHITMLAKASQTTKRIKKVKGHSDMQP